MSNKSQPDLYLQAKNKITLQGEGGEGQKRKQIIRKQGIFVWKMAFWTILYISEYVVQVQCNSIHSIYSTEQTQRSTTDKISTYMNENVFFVMKNFSNKNW